MSPIDDEGERAAREWILEQARELELLRQVLRMLIQTCPNCKGTGEVKKWITKDPDSKEHMGFYKGMKPCPYCSKARQVLGDNPLIVAIGRTDEQDQD